MSKVAENLEVAFGRDDASAAGRQMERQPEMDLSGKVVIITGASRGVGKQAALDFARRGANVVLAIKSV